MTNNPNAFVSVPREAQGKFRYDKSRRTLIPAMPGYYWAKWQRAAGDTHEGEHLTPSDSWEIVQVNDNNVRDQNDDEYLSVSVCGVRETQWRDCFVWGAFVAPLERPAAALAAAPSAPVVSGEEWLPIETAPFGEVVLICNPDKGRLQCVAVYSKTANIWRVANTLTPIDVPPTHWRPLPAPPGQAPSAVSGEEELRKALEEARETIEQLAESLSVARDRLGMTGEGDGKDRKADAPDSISSLPALQAARTSLNNIRAVLKQGRG